MFLKQENIIMDHSSAARWRTVLSSPRKIMKEPNINPYGTPRGTAPRRECQTDTQGTCSHITCRLKDTLHADCVRCKSATLYSCLPLHQDLYISTDKHVTRNGKWCPLLAELSVFRVWHALFWGMYFFIYVS